MAGDRRNPAICTQLYPQEGLLGRRPSLDNGHINGNVGNLRSRGISLPVLASPNPNGSGEIALQITGQPVVKDGIEPPEPVPPRDVRITPDRKLLHVSPRQDIDIISRSAVQADILASVLRANSEGTLLPVSAIRPDLPEGSTARLSQMDDLEKRKLKPAGVELVRVFEQGNGGHKKIKGFYTSLPELPEGTPLDNNPHTLNGASSTGSQETILIVAAPVTIKNDAHNGHHPAGSPPYEANGKALADPNSRVRRPSAEPVSQAVETVDDNGEIQIDPLERQLMTSSMVLSRNRCMLMLGDGKYFIEPPSDIFDLSQRLYAQARHELRTMPFRTHGQIARMRQLLFDEIQATYDDLEQRKDILEHAKTPNETQIQFLFTQAQQIEEAAGGQLDGKGLDIFQFSPEYFRRPNLEEKVWHFRPPLTKNDTASRPVWKPAIDIPIEPGYVTTLEPSDPKKSPAVPPTEKKPQDIDPLATDLNSLEEAVFCVLTQVDRRTNELLHTDLDGLAERAQEYQGLPRLIDRREKNRVKEEVGKARKRIASLLIAAAVRPNDIPPNLAVMLQGVSLTKDLKGVTPPQLADLINHRTTLAELHSGTTVYAAE